MYNGYTYQTDNAIVQYEVERKCYQLLFLYHNKRIRQVASAE
jgi:hypothetical protein